MDSPAKTALVYLWAPFANLLWYAETVVMGTISLLVWPFDHSGEMQHACARWWCRMVALTIGARIHVYGIEQVQAGPGVRWQSRQVERGSSEFENRVCGGLGRDDCVARGADDEQCGCTRSAI